MTDFLKLRETMVRTQLIPRGIGNERVLEAMRKVPRHLFVGSSMEHAAYEDRALPIGEGQTISQPYMVAIMTELLGPDPEKKFLEVGTGSGYQAAVLAELVKDVFTVERVASLGKAAGERFRSLHYDNIHVLVGDGTLGWAEHMPYDGIIITAASPRVPEPLLEQLATGGTLVVPVGSRFSQQLLRITKTKDGLKEEYHTPCVFVPLIGKYGWQGEDEGSSLFDK